MAGKGRSSPSTAQAAARICDTFPMASVELRLRGPIQLGTDDAPVPLGGPKQRAVPAKLALAIGQAVSADELIDLVWGDGPQPAQQRRTLQVYIANLRKLLRLRSLDIAGTGA